MSHEEDDDAFLYGTDDEAVAVKKQKLDNGTESATKTETTTADHEGTVETGNDEEGDEEESEYGSDEEDDSDSDIEFIISTEDTTKPAAEEKATTDSTIPSSTTTATAAATAIVPEALGEVNDLDDEEATSAQPQTTGATITRVPDVDINKVGEYEGKPITNINIQDLKEKPWRQPGADVSEYFNYGFDEFTWVAYCAKQDNLRTNFNPQKVMMSMMPMGLPPMPMMMPGLPVPPNLAGIPPPPSIPQQPPQSQSTQSTPPVQEGNTSQDDDKASLPQQSQNSNFNSGAIPRGPSGGNRDFKDREFERGYNNEYRDRDPPRRGRYRGRR